jgi:VWFA-related protein
MTAPKWLFALFAISESAIGAPQSAPQVPTLHAETRVVQIEVVARDSHGHPVGTLSKNDFIVTDQGQPRAIDIFSADAGLTVPNQSAPPLLPSGPGRQMQTMPPGVFSNRNAAPQPETQHSTVILLDHVNGDIVNAAIERDGVLSLLKKARPDERIALYVIGKLSGVILLQDYTTNRELLMKSMREYVPAHLDPPKFPQFSGAGAPPPLVPLVVEDTSELVRLSLQSLAEHLALLPGRKSVYWVSLGFSPRLMHGPAWEPKGQALELNPAWQKTIDTLNEADVAVNAVDAFPRVRASDTGPALVMKEIAHQTGGQAWFGGSNDIGAELAQGIDDSRTTYTLGFYLAEGERDDKFHDLKVQTARPGLQLAYRQGYYAGNTDLPGSGTGNTGLLEAALLNQVDSHDVGISATVDIIPGTPRDTANVHMNLDTRTLALTEQAGSFKGKVEEMFVELNEAGRSLAKISDVKDFEFTAATREHYDSAGVTWPFTVPLVEGATKLAIIVRDSGTGRIGSLTVPLAPGKEAR